MTVTTPSMPRTSVRSSLRAERGGPPHGGPRAILKSPTAEDLGRFIKQSLMAPGVHRITACRPGDLRRARREPAFRHVLETSHLLMPARQVMPFQSKDVITDSHRLMDAVLTWARDLDRRVFFLGGRGRDPFDWARRASLHYRRLRLAGAWVSGPDLRDQSGAWRLVERINAAEPDIVVCMPSNAWEEELAARFSPRMKAALFVQVHGRVPRPLRGSS